LVSSYYLYGNQLISTIQPFDSLTLFFLEVAVATILGDVPLWLMKLFLLSLGFWIRVENFDPKVLRECKIVASNHTTAFDVFPFLQLFKLQVMIDKGFFQSIFAKVLTNIIGAIPLERCEFFCEKADEILESKNQKN
jgi:1-acyl-sn-glycerol-3-phosphate acyltransferase